MRIKSGIMMILAVMTIAAQARAYECKVCHSKNPKMVAMHKALLGKNCFECHKVGAKLMGKGQPKDNASLLKRRISETICLECHGNQAAQSQTPIPLSPVRP